MIAMRMHANGSLAMTVLLAASLVGQARCGRATEAAVRETATDFAAELAAAERRPYVTGMIGSSLATTEATQGGDTAGGPPPGGGFTSSLLHGEGAIGVAIARPAGGLRVEFEGRRRATPNLSEELWTSRPAADVFRAAVGNEWSTMANAWRDLQFTDQFGGYLGGGLGIGGCTYAFVDGRTVGGAAKPVAGSVQMSGFAWQLGGGITYALTDRITCDVGYRFHTLEPTGAGRHLPAEAAAAGGSSFRLSAGEIVFAVRIYEPFQGWLRSPSRNAGDAHPHALAGGGK